MSRRRYGLQSKWDHVVDSLEKIVPSYEVASSRISMFTDGPMRREAVSYAVRKGWRVLDLGAGPGTMSRVVRSHEGEPVLLDVSRMMLSASSFPLKVCAAFESLPFRDGVFDAVVSGFAVRDSYDLAGALSEVRRVVRGGGRFAFCDLGKPDSAISGLLVAFYLRTGPPTIGLLTAGRAGLRYGSLFDTYLLAPRNSELVRSLGMNFGSVSIHERQLGASIVVTCVKRP